MTRKHTALTAFWTIVGIVAGVVLIVVAYFGYWAVEKDATSRRADIGRSTFEFQQAQRDALVRLTADVADIDVQITTASPDTAAALHAQRAAIVAQACRAAAEIDGGYPNGTEPFVLIECGG